MSEQKNKVGRPTDYKDEYNDIAMDFLSQGKSIIQLCGKLRVGRATIYRWAEQNKEFRDTLQLGKELSQAHWEDKLEGMMFNKEVNSPLVKLYFANRFGWSDKAETKNENATTDKVKSFGDLYQEKKS